MRRRGRRRGRFEPGEQELGGESYIYCASQGLPARAIHPWWCRRRRRRRSLSLLRQAATRVLIAHLASAALSQQN